MAAKDKSLTYRALATPRFRAAVGLVAAAGTLAAWTFVPAALLPLWLVASTLGVLVAVVDATLTWVPARLCHLIWVAAALSLIGVRALGGSWAVLEVMVVAAAAVGLAFLVVWRVTYPNLGFADVRFAPVVAALAASSGTGGLILAGLGTAVIAVMQLPIRRVRKRDRMQPYIPAMLAGPFLAAVLTAAAAGSL